MSTSIDLTWGEQLLITVRRRHKKGLAPIVDYIRQVVGRGAGSRNSFAKCVRSRDRQPTQRQRPRARRAAYLERVEGYRVRGLLEA